MIDSFLISTHLTSPWRVHRQLSLSSLSHWSAKEKQLPSFPLRNLGSHSLPLSLPPPPLLAKCCQSLAQPFEAAVGCTLLSFLPQTHNSCGTSRPLLHTGLDGTRWVSLRRANSRGLSCHIFIALGVTHPLCLWLSIPANERGTLWLCR